MANYALKFFGDNGIASIPAWQATGDYTIVLTFTTPSALLTEIVVGTLANDFIAVFDDGRYGVRADASNVYTSATGIVVANSKYELTLSKVGNVTTYDLRLGASSVDSGSYADYRTMTIDRASQNDGLGFSGSIDRLQLNRPGDVRDYYSSVNTGSVWTDIGGGSQDATLVGMPTDGSQWVEIPAGGGRSITDIDGDNAVQAGQTGVVITGSGFDLPISGVILGGQAVTVTGTPTATNITVDIPLHINLEWGGTANDLVVTDNTGQLTLNNVTLSTPTGWETVTFNGTPPDTATTESLYEEAITDLAFTGEINDIYAWESQPGLTHDAQTIPIVSPAGTVTFDYKVWDSSAGSWTAVSSGTWTDGGPLESTLNIAVSGIPDGSYMTVLDNEDGERISRQNETYSNEVLNVVLPVLPGTRVKGYVNDAADPSTNGAYLEGVTA